MVSRGSFRVKSEDRRAWGWCIKLEILATEGAAHEFEYIIACRRIFARKRPGRQPAPRPVEEAFSRPGTLKARLQEKRPGR